MKDTDWPALSQKYHGLAKQSRTADEFNYIANRLIGEISGALPIASTFHENLVLDGLLIIARNS